MHLEDYNYDDLYSPLKGDNGSENTNNYIIIKSKTNEKIAIMFGYTNIPYSISSITVNFPTAFRNPPYVFSQQVGHNFMSTRPVTVTAVKSQSFSVVINGDSPVGNTNERAERIFWLAIGAI